MLLNNYIYKKIDGNNIYLNKTLDRIIYKQENIIETKNSNINLMNEIAKFSLVNYININDVILSESYICENLNIFITMNIVPYSYLVFVLKVISNKCTIQALLDDEVFFDYKSHANYAELETIKISRILTNKIS